MKKIAPQKFIRYSIFNTPIGFCGLVSSNKGLVRITFGKESEESIISVIKSEYPDSIYFDFEKYRNLMERYFNGERILFNDIPLDIEKYTPFQKKVWEITSSITYREVRTYKWISLRIGLNNGFRAVGRALSLNPIPIVIPCHRVINENGKLGGFSQGLSLKIHLLKLEGSL